MPITLPMARITGMSIFKRGMCIRMKGITTTDTCMTMRLW